MAVPVSDLQSAAPSAIIELFELALDATKHGSSDVYRFHAGSSMNNNGEIVWNGNSYLRYPVEAEGFEYSGNGQLPRPKIRVSNVLSTVTAIMLSLPSGLEGARVTRVRTLARYLDNSNWAGGNPYGTPDPTAEFPREIYYIDRKTVETRELVEFELAAVFDLAGVRAPKRQCIGNICQWQYKSAECSYIPAYSNNLSTQYVTAGYYAGAFINITGAFNPTFYLAAYPDVVAAGYTAVTAYQHWINYGLYEGRYGNAGGPFDPSQYLAMYPNLSGLVYFDENDTPVGAASADVCGKRLDSCKARFGSSAELPFGSFPGIGTYFV
jgi:lambda family phage minor tail protein L